MDLRRKSIPQGLYSDDEIISSYRNAANQKQQVKILSELNVCSMGEIIKIINAYDAATNIQTLCVDERLISMTINVLVEMCKERYTPVHTPHLQVTRLMLRICIYRAVWRTIIHQSAN